MHSITRNAQVRHQLKIELCGWTHKVIQTILIVLAERGKEKEVVEEKVLKSMKKKITNIMIMFLTRRYFYLMRKMNK